MYVPRRIKVLLMKVKMTLAAYLHHVDFVMHLLFFFLLIVFLDFVYVTLKSDLKKVPYFPPFFPKVRNKTMSWCNSEWFNATWLKDKISLLPFSKGQVRCWQDAINPRIKNIQYHVTCAIYHLVSAIKNKVVWHLKRL